MLLKDNPIYQGWRIEEIQWRKINFFFKIS